ncbi:MAG TPA: hypothetical protein VK466_14390 [Terriglobales bacterium]|nr:hypothetical protein [Terriglobales bacterium]
MTTLEKPATIQIVLSTIVPFILGLCATRVTMAIIGEQHGVDTAPFLLVGWCIALGASAAWLNWAVFRRIKMLLPFLLAVVVILLVWSSQRYAFTLLVPRSGLTYGYFLKPEGAKARFWTLTCPFRAGITGLLICFIAGVVSAWRAGFRALLVCVIPWWMTAFLIFSLPSMYLDAQGNASVFI